MMKAAMPMTGGISWPPVEATDSMAAASCGLKPRRFIMGMVTTPVVTTLATTLPDIVPKSEEPRIAILAGPPRYRPISAMEMSVKNAEPPDLKRTLPKNTNVTTTVVMIFIGTPKMAVESQTM